MSSRGCVGSGRCVDVFVTTEFFLARDLEPLPPFKFLTIVGVALLCVIRLI